MRFQPGGAVRELAASTGFRRLLAVRLTSQFGDGLFHAGLAWLVLLSPERQQTPAAVATAAAVVLLPFSVVGPFTGVFLDRWSRRQVLVLGETVRVGLTLLLVAAASTAKPGVAVYAVAVGCLGVNRFCLAAMSAGLPHVVRRHQLVTANAVAPTAGTIVTLCGFGVGGLVLAASPDAGSRTALALAAGLLGLRLSRGGLGPDGLAASSGVRNVGGDLAAGLRHLRERRRAGLVLGVFGCYRFWYGLWSVQAAMLTLGDPAGGDLSAAALVALASGAGFLAGAVVTPYAKGRFGESRWLSSLLVGAAATTAATALAPRPGALAVIGFGLGMAAQSLKICTDTALQRHVDDSHRGRAFAVYDVVFNLTFVTAAALAVLVVPPSGRSVLAPLLGGTALFATALAYRRLRCGLDHTEPARDRAC